MPEEVSIGLALRFDVVVDGHDLGAWSKCTGLDVEFDIVRYVEGTKENYTHFVPGRTKYPEIKLTRAMTPKSNDVATWLSGLQKKPEKGTGSITLLDASGQKVFAWELQGVLPAKWTGPQLDASSAQVALETLELVHEGFLAD